MFPDTHPAIIGREDFATVQELRAHRRRPTKSGIVSMFSGMLYCADCGEKLYYSATNNYKREHAYFFCSSFRKDTDVCSAHFIREKVVEQLVLESLQRVFAMIQVFEKRFAQEQMAAYNKERQKELAEKRRKLNGAQKRIAEIDGLIQRIYEDNASGRLSDDRYATMSIAYENEQRALKESLSTLSEDLKREMDSSEGLHQFIDRVKQTVRPTVLTPELVHGFIEKIVVHAPEYNENRKRTQAVDIYYNGVGIIPNYSLEGMEQAVKDWQKKHAETVKTA